MKWTDEDREKVFELYTKDDMNIRQIHGKLGIPTATIIWMLRKQQEILGIKLPKKLSSGRKRYKHSFKLNVISMVIQEKKTIDDAAKEAGVFSNTVYNWVRKYKQDKKFRDKLHLNVDIEEKAANIDIKIKENKNDDQGYIKPPYTDAIKLACLDRVLNSKESIRKVANNLKINPSNINNWLLKHKSDPDFYKDLEDSVSKNDHDYYNDIGKVWYLDKDELLYLKKLIDDGHDDWTCSYIVGVAYKDYNIMKNAALALK